MNLLLAQALPDPNAYSSMGWVIAVLFAIATGALVLKQLFTRSPALHEEFVTRKEFEALRGEVEAVSEEVTQGFRQLDHKRSVSVANLHTAITGLGNQVRNEIKTDTAAVHIRINDILAAVSRLEGSKE